MPSSSLENNVLMRKIRDAYASRFTQPPSRDEVEQFVLESFKSRNVQATPALIEQTVDYLLSEASNGEIKGRNIRPC